MDITFDIYQFPRDGQKVFHVNQRLRRIHYGLAVFFKSYAFDRRERPVPFERLYKFIKNHVPFANADHIHVLAFQGLLRQDGRMRPAPDNGDFPASSFSDDLRDLDRKMYLSPCHTRDTRTYSSWVQARR